MTDHVKITLKAPGASAKERSELRILSNFKRLVFNKSIMHEADPTSQSNYLEIATKHITFDWKVDFDNKVIAGTATHEVVAKADGVSEVM